MPSQRRSMLQHLLVRGLLCRSNWRRCYRGGVRIVKYKVTQITTQDIVVEGNNPSDALGNACDYGNQYNWSIERLSYEVEGVL